MGIMVRERAQYHESGLMEVAAQNSGSSSFDAGSELQDEARLPTGWEKCLDLKSGLIYFKNWNTGTLTYRDPRQSVQRQSQRIGLLSISLEQEQQQAPPSPLLAPGCKRKFDDSRVSSTVVDGLELSLNLPGTKAVQTSSVCTMERVRSALERLTQHKRRLVLDSTATTTTTTSSNPATTLSLLSSSTSVSSPGPKSESSESSSDCFTSPSVMSFQGDESEEVQQQPREIKGSTVMVTVGCKRCLMYVMLSKSHPSCPKCGNTDDVLLELPMPPIPKRRRLKSPSSWSWCTE